MEINTCAGSCENSGGYPGSCGIPLRLVHGIEKGWAARQNQRYTSELAGSRIECRNCAIVRDPIKSVLSQVIDIIDD